MPTVRIRVKGGEGGAGTGHSPRSSPVVEKPDIIGTCIFCNSSFPLQTNKWISDKEELKKLTKLFNKIFEIEQSFVDEKKSSSCPFCPTCSILVNTLEKLHEELIDLESKINSYRDELVKSAVTSYVNVSMTIPFFKVKHLLFQRWHSKWLIGSPQLVPGTQFTVQEWDPSVDEQNVEVQVEASPEELADCLRKCKPGPLCSKSKNLSKPASLRRKSCPLPSSEPKAVPQCTRKSDEYESNINTTKSDEHFTKPEMCPIPKSKPGPLCSKKANFKTPDSIHSTNSELPQQCRQKSPAKSVQDTVPSDDDSRSVASREASSVQLSLSDKQKLGVLASMVFKKLKDKKKNTSPRKEPDSDATKTKLNEDADSDVETSPLPHSVPTTREEDSHTATDLIQNLAKPTRTPRIEIVDSGTESEDDDDVCKICYRVCRSKELLEAHMKTHAGNNKKYKCSECKKTFFDSWRMEQHMKSVHGKQLRENESPVKKPEKRRISDMSNTSSTSVSASTSRINFGGIESSGEEEVEASLPSAEKKSRSFCEICKLSFGSRKRLSKHMRKQHGRKSSETIQDNMESTVKTSTDNESSRLDPGKTFKCIMCPLNKVFLSELDYQSHFTIIHRGLEYMEPVEIQSDDKESPKTNSVNIKTIIRTFKQQNPEYKHINFSTKVILDQREFKKHCKNKRRHKSGEVQNSYSKETARGVVITIKKPKSRVDLGKLKWRSPDHYKRKVGSAGNSSPFKRVSGEHDKPHHSKYWDDPKNILASANTVSGDSCILPPMPKPSPFRPVLKPVQRPMARKKTGKTFPTKKAPEMSKVNKMAKNLKASGMLQQQKPATLKPGDYDPTSSLIALGGSSLVTKQTFSPALKTSAIKRNARMSGPAVAPAPAPPHQRPPSPPPVYVNHNHSNSNPDNNEDDDEIDPRMFLEVSTEEPKTPPPLVAVTKPLVALPRTEPRPLAPASRAKPRPKSKQIQLVAPVAVPSEAPKVPQGITIVDLNSIMNQGISNSPNPVHRRDSSSANLDHQPDAAEESSPPVIQDTQEVEEDEEECPIRIRSIESLAEQDSPEKNQDEDDIQVVGLVQSSVNPNTATTSSTSTINYFPKCKQTEDQRRKLFERSNLNPQQYQHQQQQREFQRIVGYGEYSQQQSSSEVPSVLNRPMPLNYSTGGSVRQMAAAHAQQQYRAQAMSPRFYHAIAPTPAHQQPATTAMGIRATTSAANSIQIPIRSSPSWTSTTSNPFCGQSTPRPRATSTIYNPFPTSSGFPPNTSNLAQMPNLQLLPNQNQMF